MSIGTVEDELNGLEILSVRFTFLGVFDHIERYALSLVEGCHAGLLDGADMYENVFGPVFRADETEAFCTLKNFTVPTAMAAPRVSLSRH